MASSQVNAVPGGSKNYIENVAIVGVGGRSGSIMAEALIRGKKHRVTAITRPESTNQLPSGLSEVKKVKYEDHESLVKALEGQDVLIITLPVLAPADSQTRLIDAAVDAGVRWIMPNEWGVDISNVEYAKDTFMYDRLVTVRRHIEKVGRGRVNWVGLCCGFWYEFSLAGTEARYGFDFDKKEVTFYDDGNTKINTSTWPQVGRAVASLLSLKVVPDSESDRRLCLSQCANRSVHISSFFVSQRDMFESVLRASGDKESDWKLHQEDVVERYERGKQMMQEGQIRGFGILLYARTFYKDGVGDLNDKLDNDNLALPKEDLDHATQVAIDMALSGNTNAIH